MKLRPARIRENIMLENKVEVQSLVKYLLENPKEINSFQKNSKVLLAKFRIKGLDKKQLERIKNLNVGSFLGLGKHDECTNHCDFTKVVPGVTISIDFNALVRNIISRLTVSDKELISFQSNPNTLFAEYGIAPNQELVSLITRALNVVNIEPSDPNPWLDNTVIRKIVPNPKVVKK